MPAHATLTLRKPYAEGIRQGRPWVFRDAVTLPDGLETAQIVDLVEPGGAFVARGLVEPDSQLVFRAWTTDPTEAVDDILLHRRVAAAAGLRRAMLGPDVTGYRACHGENDGVPALQCDLYGDVASLRTDGRIGAVWESRFIDVVRKTWNPRAIVIRNPHVDDNTPRVVQGEVAQAVLIQERTRRFEVNILEGQKTGFFLDQRDNRDRVGALSRGRRVLNLFSYTGGFSVAAAQGGAERVVTVDIARPAIEAARRNFAHNGLPDSPHGFVAADAFDVLADAAARAKNEAPEFDVIVLDPPSFAPSQKAVERAIRAYGKLNELALSALPTGGVLATASCSSHIPEDMFLAMIGRAAAAAGRTVTIAGVYGAAPDHPTRLGFPEGQYLKFVLVYLAR